MQVWGLVHVGWWCWCAERWVAGHCLATRSATHANLSAAHTSTVCILLPHLQVALDNLRWGADYLMACHKQPDTYIAQIGEPGAGEPDGPPQAGSGKHPCICVLCWGSPVLALP